MEQVDQFGDSWSPTSHAERKLTEEGNDVIHRYTGEITMSVAAARNLWTIAKFMYRSHYYKIEVLLWL